MIFKYTPRATANKNLFFRIKTIFYSSVALEYEEV